MNPRNQDSSRKLNNPKNKRQLHNYVKYSGLAFQMIAIILLGVFGGIKLDELIKWEFPLFTVVLSVLGVILAVYYSIKDFLKTK